MPIKTYEEVIPKHDLRHSQLHQCWADFKRAQDGLFHNFSTQPIYEVYNQLSRVEAIASEMKAILEPEYTAAVKELNNAKDSVAHTVTNHRAELEALARGENNSLEITDSVKDILAQLDRWTAASNAFLGVVQKR